MSDILSSLNDAQREAVTSTEGFVRVIAGAGSGKTRALTHRFAYLVNELGIAPSNILCATFTNKAAGEMRRRIRALTTDADTGYINTFHGFCVTVLQEDSHILQYPKSFLVLDNSDIDDMLRTIYEERGLTLRDMTFSKARDMIEIEKMLNRPDYFLDMLNLSPAALREKYDSAQTPKDIIFYGYLWQEKKTFALDYNDLLKFTLYAFSVDDVVREKWQSRLEYIMIDEFQDIDRPQYELMSVLCAKHKNLMIVGDPDQTIYTWRGASGRYLLSFEQDFPGAQTIMMNENYRSSPQIIAAANSLISKNKTRIEKSLVPRCDDGAKVECYHAENTETEAAHIAGRIREMHASGVPYGDFAVLYRAHHVSRSVEEALIRSEIPYAVYSGVPFFARAEIKDALSYLRLVVYLDDLSFARVVNNPKRNIGERRMRFLKEYAEANECSLYDALRRNLDSEIMKNTKARAFVDMVERHARSHEGRAVSEVLSDLLKESGYERALRTDGANDRLDNLAELRQSVHKYEVSCGEECTIADYLTHVAMLTAADAEDTSDRVRLMTVHAAKGLEFPHVFLCAMNEGIFPSAKTQTREGMEEERRLAFVAVTRAKRTLCITDAEGRMLDGAPRYPSRFILDIDSDLLDFTRKIREDLIRDAEKHVQLSDQYMPEALSEAALPEGTRVRHAVFGDGTVTGADLSKRAHVIKFDRLATERTISFSGKLEVL